MSTNIIALVYNIASPHLTPLSGSDMHVCIRSCYHINALIQISITLPSALVPPCPCPALCCPVLPCRALCCACSSSMACSVQRSVVSTSVHVLKRMYTYKSTRRDSNLHVLYDNGVLLRKYGSILPQHHVAIDRNKCVNLAPGTRSPDWASDNQLD